MTASTRTINSCNPQNSISDSHFNAYICTRLLWYHIDNQEMQQIPPQKHVVLIHWTVDGSCVQSSCPLYPIRRASRPLCKYRIMFHNVLAGSFTWLLGNVHHQSVPIPLLQKSRYLGEFSLLIDWSSFYIKAKSCGGFQLRKVLYLYFSFYRSIKLFHALPSQCRHANDIAPISRLKFQSHGICYSVKLHHTSNHKNVGK